MMTLWPEPVLDLCYLCSVNTVHTSFLAPIGRFESPGTDHSYPAPLFRYFRKRAGSLCE